MSVKDNLAKYTKRIYDVCEASHRDPAAVRLLAISKTQEVKAIQEAYKWGQRLFGENYLQEALPKIEQLVNAHIDWHFVGAIQSNKVRDTVGKFKLIHSVDRLKIAKLINERAKALGIKQAILLEVNVGGESTKAGFSPEELEVAFDEIRHLTNLEVQGLMSFPPLTSDLNLQRQYFRQTRVTKEKLEQKFSVQLKELSMGTTLDFESAIQEGATMIRLGTAIFGERKRQERP